MIGKLAAGGGRGNAPDQEQRDHAARGIREKATGFGVREYTLSRLEYAMNQIEPVRMRPLLEEIANTLSPGTADEPVDPHF
jgi:hypothetical protein